MDAPTLEQPWTSAYAVMWKLCLCPVPIRISTARTVLHNFSDSIGRMKELLLCESKDGKGCTFSETGTKQEVRDSIH